MLRRQAIYARFVGVFLCTVTVSALLSTGRAFAAGADVPSCDAPASAQLSGKVTLRFSSTCEAPAVAEIGLATSFDGRLHIPIGPGMSCDMTAAVKAYPFSGVAYGNGAARVSARSGSGLAFDFALRKGRLSEAEDPGSESAECELSSLATSLSWEKHGGTLFCRGSYVASGWTYPYRPTRDHEEHELSGQIKVNVTSRFSLRADVSLIDNEYRLARYNTSNTRLSSMEGSYRRGRKMSVEARVERKDVRYPESPSKTYGQVKWGGAASYSLTPGLSFDCFISQAHKSFPFASAKDLCDREIVLGAGMKNREAGTLMLQGTIFERKVPASAEKGYQISAVEAQYAFSPADDLTVSVACTLSGKHYFDPAAYAGNYHEVQVSCKLSHQLARDLAIVGEAEIKRREYLLKESNNTHRVKSSVMLVYRI